MRFKKFLVCLLCMGMIFQNVNIPAFAQPLDTEVLQEEEESASVDEVDSVGEESGSSVAEDKDLDEEVESGSESEESLSEPEESDVEAADVENVTEEAAVVEETATEEITTVAVEDVSEDGDGSDVILEGYSLELSQNNTYYINDSNGISRYEYPLFFSVAGFSSSSECRTYSNAEVIIDGTSVAIGSPAYYASSDGLYTGYYIADLAGYVTAGTKDITIHVSNEMTEEDIVYVTRTVTYEKYPVEYGGASAYVSVDQASISYYVMGYNTFMEEDAENYPATILVDSEGNEVAVGKFSKAAYNAKMYKNDNRYGAELYTKLKSVLRGYGGYRYYYTYTPESELAVGTYGIKVEDGKGETTLLENVITVADGCLIANYDVYPVEEAAYDPLYLNIKVTGYNIDSSKVRPVVYASLYDEDSGDYTKGDIALSEVETVTQEENDSADTNVETYKYCLKYTGEGKWGGSYYIVMESDEGYSFTSQYDMWQVDIEVPDTYVAYTVEKVTFSPGYNVPNGDTDEEGNDIYVYERNAVYGDYIKLDVKTSSGIAFNEDGRPYIPGCLQ